MTPGERAGRRHRSAGLALALVSALSFGGSGVAAKPLITAGVDPLHVVWLRVSGAALVMVPLAWQHRALLCRRPLLLVGFGLLGVAGVQACYFAALSRIPVGVALLIEYLAPALVLGWVRFVQRRTVSRAAAVGVVLATCGLCSVVEVWSGLGFDALGLLLALGAAGCQAGYLLLADHGSDAGDGAPDPFGVIAYGLIAGAVVLTAVARPWTINWVLLAGDTRMNGSVVPAAVLVGWIVLLGTVLAYVTGVTSVRRLTPQVAGVVACLEAVVATVLAWFLLGEHLGAPQLVGGTVVLLGALVAQSATGRRPAPDPVAAGHPETTPDGAPVAADPGPRL